MFIALVHLTLRASGIAWIISCGLHNTSYMHVLMSTQALPHFYSYDVLKEMAYTLISLPFLVA